MASRKTLSSARFGISHKHLRRVKRRFAITQDNSVNWRRSSHPPDDGILSKNLNGIITSWNAAATRILGYSAEEMIGSSIFKLIPEELHSEEKDNY